MKPPIDLRFIRPDWPEPPGVRACASTRLGGVSRGDWSGLNLGDHVGDAPAAVAANRGLLCRALDLPQPPTWLQQVHGTRVVHLPDGQPGSAADAAWCDGPGPVCAVLTADCLPVLLAAVDGSSVAAAHAGWRGLCDGVLEATLAALPAPADRIQAWIGPAIGPTVYEVGEEVRQAFVGPDPGLRSAFVPTRPGHWLADLPGIARRRLRAAGVGAVYGGALCTFSDARRFYSYRRDGRTGRTASLIWIAPR